MSFTDAIKFSILADAEWEEYPIDIKYIINTNEKDSVQGHYLIGTSVDSFYGINASCHQSIEFYKNNKKISKK